MSNLNLLMSFGTISLLIIWLIDPQLKRNFNRLTINNPSTWIVGLFLIHLIWLIGTTDFDYAAKDLRIKLPLMALAISIGTLKLSKAELLKVFLSLGVGVTFATTVGYYLYLSDPMIKMDPRSMVPNISHIRLSLVFTVFVVGVYSLRREIPKRIKTLSLLAVLNALFFLYLLQTLTSVIVLIVGVGFLLISHAYNILRVKQRVLIWIPLAVALVASFVLLQKEYSNYFKLSENAMPLLEKSAKGNAYQHLDLTQIENGNYVYANVVPRELIAAWNSRSNFKVRNKSEDLYLRLMRYITAKGLTKDEQGVLSLSKEDIKYIEAGFPAPAYVEKNGLWLRLHAFLHGTHLYLTNDYVVGSSFYQRFIYWSIGASIAEENFLFGVGTGDVKSAFKEAYKSSQYSIEARYQLRAHNQYITFLVTFGILGLCYFLGMLGKLLARWRNVPLFAFFTIAAIISFLTEDTLETQAGVTFFAFFLSLFSASEDEYI